MVKYQLRSIIRATRFFDAVFIKKDLRHDKSRGSPLYYMYLRGYCNNLLTGEPIEIEFPIKSVRTSDDDILMFENALEEFDYYAISNVNINHPENDFVGVVDTFPKAFQNADIYAQFLKLCLRVDQIDLLFF